MPDQLLKGYDRFKDGYYADHKDDFIALADGQSPETCVIACCDSRVDVSLIFDMKPGDLFIVRNVANLAPPFDNDGRPKGTSSALEFAVTGLNVKQIVILGHTSCGGIKALMDRESDGGDTFVDQWMTIADKTKKEVIARGLPKNEQYTACEQGTIIQSLQNLMTFPWIAERVNEGSLSLHGMYYDLSDGALMCYEPDAAKFVPAGDLLKS